MPKSDSERLAVVETKLDILTEEIKKLSDKLDSALPIYVTKEQHDMDISKLYRQRFVQNTLAAILGATISLLLGFFITHIGV